MSVSDSLHSLLDYECLLFLPWLTLVLIYESVTFSPSFVRWLALYSWMPNYWTLNCLQNAECRITTHEWTELNSQFQFCNPNFLMLCLAILQTVSLITSRRTDYKSPSQAVPLLYSVFIRCYKTCLATSRKPLSSSGLFCFFRCRRNVG
jgi:hypothetical protein